VDKVKIPKTLQQILQNVHDTQKALAEYIAQSNALHEAHQKQIEVLEKQVSALLEQNKRNSPIL